MDKPPLSRIPAVTKILSTPLDIDEPFMSLAARFAHLPGTVVLMSGGRLDCARYHIMAVRPFLSFAGKRNRLELKIGEVSYSFQADPMAALKKILSAAKGKLPMLPGPVQAGLFGYLSYDLKDHLERLPRTAVDDFNLPEICFYAPALIVVQDRIEKQRTLYRVIHEGIEQRDGQPDYDWFRQLCARPAPQSAPFKGVRETLRSNFSRPDYLSALDEIHEYIAAGHVYQVNMSQRFSMAYHGSGFDLFRRLFEMNPAPFFAFIQAGDHEIVSTSPERFLRQEGKLLETRPIKGTRKRGADNEEDRALRHELINSPKDDAELSMIVDLMRNDLGRVCREKTVRVLEHKRVETYENVFHLISIVTGELAAGRDAVDVIAATFPGGSITGCPKVRAMEIIDELEPNCRHLYTGSIGYISLHDTMDLSIAIRTAVLTGGRIHFGVGGGIVFDSNPADEFEETLHKGRTLMTACLGQETGDKKEENFPENESMVWFNGKFMPAGRAGIPATDPGLQYGYGFFETIRAEKGRPRRLSDHLERFKQSWESLYRRPFPDLSWELIINRILKLNGLHQKTAAVKLLTAKEASHAPPYHPHLLVSARPYTHRLTLLGCKGLKLGIYPYPRQSPLADHKTLNYLYYYQAGQWAKANGFDEALIVNPDNSFSETNTGNLFIMRDQTLFEPASAHVLPGVMAKTFRQTVAESGYQLIRKPFFKEEMLSSDRMWVTNALMGAVPVLSINGIPLGYTEALYRTLNQKLIATDWNFPDQKSSAG